MDGWPRRRLSRAHLAGFLALALAPPCGSCEPWPLPFGLVGSPAAVPLALFVAACIAASFYPSWSFFLTVVSHGPRRRAAVALSFDDGPDPATTPRLLDLLEGHGVRAAFFVVGRSAEAWPDLVARIRAGGHEIGNHSLSHDPLLMLRSERRLEAEIAACQRILAAHGVVPLAFRPPVGITNPRLARVLRRLHLGCVGFSCRPLDFGNARLEGLAQKVIADARAGDIVLLHDVAPCPGSVEAWLSEVERILAGLKQRGLAVVPVSELIGRPLMASLAAGVEPERRLRAR